MIPAGLILITACALGLIGWLTLSALAHAFRQDQAQWQQPARDGGTEEMRRRG